MWMGVGADSNLHADKQQGFITDASPGHCKGQTTIHANNYTYMHLEWPVHLTFMCLDYGRKQEHLEGHGANYMILRKKNVYL